MRKFLVIALTLFNGVLLTAQTLCSKYPTEEAKLQEVKTQFRKERTEVNYQAVKAQAQQTAQILQECMLAAEADAAVTAVKRRYLTGVTFWEAGLEENALEYLTACVTHPKSGKVRFDNGETYRARAEAFLSFITSPRESVNRTVAYDRGHGAFTVFQQELAPGASKPKLLREEVEMLMARRATIKGTNKKRLVSTYKTLSGSSNVYLSEPFVVIDADGGNLRTRANQKELSRPLKVDHIQLFYTYLNQNLFKNPAKYYVPIYSFTSKLNGAGYIDFDTFARQVHFENAGGRVAYFQQADQSVVAWEAAGEGVIRYGVLKALIGSDYPEVSPWLKEGLAAFYEENALDFGPLDNYRLAYLQEAIAQGKCLPGIRNLIIGDSGVFRGEEAMLYTAAARYLMILLYEQGVLGNTYAQLRDAKDQSAENQLKIVLETLGSNANDFDNAWKNWLGQRQVPAKYSSLGPGVAAYIKGIGCQ